MVIRVTEPFSTALAELRRRIREGEFLPDTRLVATELAEPFGLSPTPIREALSRLAGEGLLEDRRGQGFFVRRLTRGDIQALFGLSLAHLSLAAEPANGMEEVRMDDPDPVLRTERMFAAWVAADGRRVLAQSFARVQAQLGPVRRLEPRILGDLEAEAEALAGTREPAQRMAAVRRFHRRRIRAAGRMIDLLDRGRRIAPI